jgi:hypothetical protein
MISLPLRTILGVPVCHDTTVMTYAPYLRVCEPVAAATCKRVRSRRGALAEYEMANRVPSRPGGYFAGAFPKPP